MKAPKGSLFACDAQSGAALTLLKNTEWRAQLDVPALAAYCYSFGQWRMAAEALAKMQANDPIMGAQLVKTKYGDAALNPLVSIVRKHAGDVVRYAGEFGLTAAARSRMIRASVNPQPPPSKFDGLIGGCTVTPIRSGDG
ncbi:P27 family phage terminase small subunit [Bradyrhizobium sp. KB893862 SZCCT0404]|uniref:P27 family phage terminase small subunit n=1 Tax=Bradyrhizobium sp. KB893862 SZCCT0404 TaxID=2807672 RepID=UPI001BADEB8D|nr:P27 family phage terminase small subunit [Bradyrhizobium sp. KB893862 SZCCT0404]MBR1174882.1 P27 family phage terminase small subunit [Bradyrhizobium sp. KB893862 SZCCT0404]